MSETNPTILCVDDDPDARNLLKFMLSKNGFDPREADSGQEVLKILESWHPDLILMDALMPGMDGYETCSRFQENPEWNDIPVIFVTGLAHEQDKVKAFAAGAVDYLVKPVKRADLLEKVNKHLRTTERWRLLLQPQREKKGKMGVTPSDYPRFKEFFMRELGIPQDQQAKLALLPANELYTLSTELGISDIQLAQSIAEFTSLPYLGEIDPNTIQLGVLPLNFCRSNQVLALRIESGEISFVLSNPFKWELLDALQMATGFGGTCKMMITPPDNIKDLLALRPRETSKTKQTQPQQQQKSSISDLEEQLRERHQPSMDAGEEIDPETLETESAPMIELINHIIQRAHEMGASDIHIEPREHEIVIRYRLDGHLIVVNRFRPRTLIRPMVARIKVMSALDISERRLPQDGRIAFRNFGRDNANVDLRVSLAPTNYGEKVVMRLLDKKKAVLPLKELGFSKRNLDLYREKIRTPYGMILHVGPTGSGKSMTLYAALNEVKRPELNIQTIEDPIEYTLDAISQMQVNPEIGLTFARGLRCYLRQDPDVILVGEIRDKETAQIAVESAMTGHLLLSTLHTNDAASTVTRFLEMGIEPFMISASLVLVCAQRLVRRLCPECKQAYEPDLRERDLSGAPAQGKIVLYRAKGCAQCKNIGYKGRVGVHELLVPTDEMRHLINEQRVSAEAVKRMAFERSGMVTLYWDAMEKVHNGLCGLEDVLSNIRLDEFDTRPEWFR